MKSVIPKVYTRARAITDSDIYISGEILAPEEYIEEFQTLLEAGEGDHINLYINSPGGRIDTAVQFLSRMKSTKATITGHIEGLCQSAGTYLFLAADQWVVNDNCLMLIHNYSGGAYGKGSEVLLNVKANDTWVRDLMADIYEGFLSEEELAEVNKNQDIWLTSKKILSRLDGVVEMRTAKVLAHEEALRIKLDGQLKEYSENVTENTSGVQESSTEQ